MDYLKHILQKEKINLGELDVFSSLFEMLSNQQEFKNVLKKSMSLIKSLEGEVSLVSYESNKFKLISNLGDKDMAERFLEEKVALKHVAVNKKPYFYELAEEKFDYYYMILPILSKEEFLGALCIHKEQDIKCWKEIHLLLHMMAFILKYYDLIDLNKNINTKDMVTNLFNYRHFQDQLDLEIEKATRYHVPVSLVMIDLADFKLINQRLGYDAGDQVLKQVGEWIQQTCRRVDMPARLDKDTFAILLTSTNDLGAKTLLKRILIKVQNKMVKVAGKEFKVRIKSSSTQYQLHLSKDEFIDKAVNDLKVQDYKDFDI